MRRTLLGLYQEQLMDNLIRAQQGLPFVHMDYSNITGTAETNLQFEISADQTIADNRYGVPGEATPPTAVESFATIRTVTDKLLGKATPSQKNQLTIKAEPVTNVNSVYTDYLTYLRDHRLECSNKKPTDKIAHVYRKHGKKYFYVKKEDRDAFFSLYLSTTVMRGEPIARLPYYEANILGVRDTKPLEGGGTLLVLRLSKKIPNDSGELSVVLEGKETKFTLQPVRGLDRNKPTDELVIVVRERNADIPALTKSLEGKTGQFWLENNTPEFKTKAQDLLQDIRDILDLQRLGQF